MLKNVSRNQATLNILKQVNPDYYLDPDGPTGALPITIKDPWDNNLKVVFPGRLFRDNNEPAGVVKDNDGTIRTIAENRYGICVSRKICFLSMGSDSLAGNLQLDTPAASVKQPALDRPVEVAHLVTAGLGSAP